MTRPLHTALAALLFLSGACGGETQSTESDTRGADVTRDAGPGASDLLPDLARFCPDAAGCAPDVGPDAGLADIVDVPDLPPFEEDVRPRRDFGGPPDVWTPNFPDVPIPGADVPSTESLCSPVGDGVWNIYDLQNPACGDHPDPEPTGPPGLDVVLGEVIVTAVFSDLMFVQEPQGGPWSGLYVFCRGACLCQQGAERAEVAPGDVLEVEGSYSEFFEATQVHLQRCTIEDRGPVPAPFPIAHPQLISTEGALAEAFEGVLVRVEDVYVTNTNPDCPGEFGEVALTGGLRVDDLATLSWEPRIGDHLSSVTGPLHYTFGNTKIEPRSDEDVVLLSQGTGGVTKCVDYDCIVPEGAATTGEVVIHEIMADPYGSDAFAEYIELYNPNGYTLSLDGWRLADCTGQMLSIEVSPGNTIPPRGYFVLGASDDTDQNGGLPVDFVYGQGFYLPNSVGSVILFDSANALVDQVRYQRFAPWNFQVGRALELIDPTWDNMRPESWGRAQHPYGDGTGYGTPGFANDPFPYEAPDL